MRKLLNTLFVTLPDAYLSRDGANIVVSVMQEERFRIPSLNVEAIIAFGYKGVSPGLMALCAENGIALSFLTQNGRYIGRFQGQTKGNVLLRKNQYGRADDETTAIPLARLFIAAKIQNSRSVLQRFLRDYGECPAVEQAAEKLNALKKESLHCNDREGLMGVEGAASAEYFGCFPHLILCKDEVFAFRGRNRRPPRDAINAMLSFAYTLLTNETTAALEAVGLDPCVGFLHALRPGRTSLALDLIEEFRACLCDRFVLSLVNRNQLSAKSFLRQGEESVILTDEGRKTFLTAWQLRKKECVMHPFLNEKIEIGLLPHAQAMLLARFLRNDIDAYPPYLVR